MRNNIPLAQIELPHIATHSTFIVENYKQRIKNGDTTKYVFADGSYIRTHRGRANAYDSNKSWLGEERYLSRYR